MNHSIRLHHILLIAGALATACALQAVAQQTVASPSAADRAIGDRANQDAVSAATDATNDWLAIVDAGKYAESWRSAAEVFKLGVKEPEWATDLDDIRNKLGKTTMRELKTAQFSTTVRGAPSTGKYVTMSYLTKFANAPIAVETLVIMKEADGVWRIAGYNISKAPDQ